MKHLTIILSLLLLSITCCNNTPHLSNKEEKIQEVSLFQEYINIGTRLQDVLNIDAVTFAAASLIVHYSESGLKTNAIGDNFSMGICQLTATTRSGLNIPLDITHQSIKQQLIYYEMFLRACPSKALARIKNSVDLGALRFAQSRNNEILSKVTNKNLKALDFDNNSYITKEDLKLFEEKRIKESSQLTHLYNSFFQ